MKTFASLPALFLTLIFALPLRAQTPAKPSKAPELVELEVLLRPLLEKAQPKTAFSWENESQELRSQFQTQKWMVHTAWMTGAWDEKAHEEWGPNYQGFLMRLTLQSAPYKGQAAFPYGTKKRLYWTDYIREYLLKDGRVVRLDLSYGAQSDKKILETIKQTLAAYAPPVGAEMDEPLDLRQF